MRYLRAYLCSFRLAALLCCVMASQAEAQRGRGDPGPRIPQPDRNANIPPLVGASAKALRDSLTVPLGFKVEYFAESIPGVRFMALGPDGSVYASQPGGRGAGGRVTRLVDSNGDGKADSASVVLSDIPGAHGLAFHNGYLHVAGYSEVLRFRLDSRGIPHGTPDTVARYGIPEMGGHRTRTVVFGQDGAMYVSVGSSCNICIETDSTFATVMRFDAGGGNGMIHARGLRNAVGMAVHPTTGEIWVSVHERDMLQPDYQNLPHEEINIIRQGAHFGWPYCHGDRVPNPDAVVADSVAAGVCSRTFPPALAIQAHAAPLGMTFLHNAANFPEDYRGDLLLALHGSWNRTVPVAPAIVRVRIRDGRPIGYEEFITGWQTGYWNNGRGDRWGRPVDVIVHKDGSLLVSDDVKGAIYRVYR